MADYGVFAPAVRCRFACFSVAHGISGRHRAGPTNRSSNAEARRISMAPRSFAAGPVVILVSLPKQWTVVYRGGVRIAATTCSTGRPGHATPSGVFIILQKDQHHHSSLYNGASMPYTERLTWGGVALHAGGLPGYPSSHGCVHLPLEFAKLLFGITTLGTPVIIATVNRLMAICSTPVC